MLRLKTIRLKNIKVFFRKFPGVLGENAFLVFLVLFVLSLISGFFIFSKYRILTKEAEPEITERQLQFNTKIYQEILEIWQEKEKRFEKADSKEYFSPFIFLQV